MNQTVSVKELAEELDMTISNLNIQIGRGKAGEVEKISAGETGEYRLTLENLDHLFKFLRIYGRGNKKKLMQTIKKYRELKENE